MSNQVVDVLILVALAEEFDELVKKHFYELSEEKQLESFKYNDFTFYDERKERRFGRIVCAGEVGDRLRDAASMFCQPLIRPTLVLNVGISGRLKDVRVGDVAVPTYVNSPTHRSAIVDEPSGGYRELPGGKPLQVSQRVLQIVKSRRFREAVQFPSVEGFASKGGKQLTSEEITRLDSWRVDKVLADIPTIIDGPFVAGAPVVKSTNYKRDVLASVDRNFIALDMESAFVAAALNNFESPPQFFAIRAISDPATGEKERFDAIGDGILRRWAVNNIRVTLKALLERTDIFAAARNGLTNAMVFEQLDVDYLDDYPGQHLLDAASLKDFDNRFANIRVAQQPRMTFSQLLQRIGHHSPGGSVLFRGRGGSGKSALLRKIQIELEREGLTDTGFVNVRKRLESSGEYTIPEIVRMRLGHLLTESERPVTVFLDELYGQPIESAFIEEVQEQLSHRKPTLIFAFGQDHYDVLSVASDSESSPYIDDGDYDLEVTVKAVSISDTEQATKVISGLIETAVEKDKPDPSKVLKDLRGMGFLYVNHFIVSLYLENGQRKAFHSLNSTQFILRAMSNLYKALYPGSNDTDFRTLCIEALRAHCRTLALKGVPDRPDHCRRSAERYQKDFAHYPKVVQTSLIANAIVYSLRLYNGQGDAVFTSLGLDTDTFFGLVFTGDVNSAVKELLVDKKIEEDILKAAEKVSARKDPMGLSYAIYLFGRANSQAGNDIAEKNMVRIGPQLSKLDAHSFNDSQTEVGPDRFWRLARRSWFISRAMKGDRAATDQYVSCVLSDPEEDRLNRSFHLEYYGDIRGIGITVQLSLNDTGADWSRTKDVLERRISAMLVRGRANEYDWICLLTYFSLIRYRHEIGTLRAEDRDAGAQLIREIMSSNLQLQIRPAIRGFISMIEHALRFERYDKIDAIVDLYKLKAMPRFGWHSRGMFPNTPTVETIGSHTFGALLLAELLADQADPRIELADRYYLARLILHHDIGEMITGDFPPSNQDKRSEEEAAVEQITALATYQGLARISQLRPLYDEFEHGNSRMILLAVDFDKLDAVFQGYIYASLFPTIANREQFFGYYRSKIKNDKLLEIAEEVIRRGSLVPLKEGTIPE